MTVLAGLFLLIDRLPHLTGRASGALLFLPFDPAWVTVVICGIPLLYLAVWRIIHNPGISKISSALLISIAMFAAIAIGDLFAAGEVAFIMAIGAILEERTTERARKGLKDLTALAPVQGRLLRDGAEALVPVGQIRAGDRLRILPGETIPVDGEIISGSTSVDQSVMTGESLPVDKEPGDAVYCGTVNRFGSIDIAATRVGEDSSMRKLIRLIQEAEARQAPMQRIADRWASWLVPVALAIAVGAYLFSRNLVTAVTVLVVFCPCALVLATPTAIMAAIGQATKNGVLIKSGEALEMMGKVDTIAFDKTGTLTQGNLDVSDVIVLDPAYEERTMLSLAASAERKSEHPLGKAVVAHALAKGIPTVEVQSFGMTAGRGVRAGMPGHTLLCGNARYLEEQGVQPGAACQDAMDRLHGQGKAVILVADNGTCIGAIALSDTLRPAAPAMLTQLAQMGTHTVLLTGDTPKAAAYFAAQAPVDEVHAGLLPAEKVQIVERLRGQGRRVCMIGDGINDAPALKTADVSVAMGGMGSDLAIDAADIALMGDDVAKIPYLKRLSVATVHTIQLSITLSMCINFVAIVLSLLNVLTPTTGALVHNAGSCLVVLIAALLYDRRFT